jgi:phosphopantothenoylcysteine synthetase/decarboxylase
MYEAVMANYGKADAVIKAAAPADFAPKEYTDHKIKKRRRRPYDRAWPHCRHT